MGQGMSSDQASSEIAVRRAEDDRLAAQINCLRGAEEPRRSFARVQRALALLLPALLAALVASGLCVSIASTAFSSISLSRFDSI